jgi:hypothetical protein
MASNTGKGSRKGAVKGRTQTENPKTGDWVKRNQEPGSPDKGEFMGNKKDGQPFKGVAKEPDKRRKKST